MKNRLSVPVISGLFGVAYFLVTMGFAWLFVEDPEARMVVAQFLNLPVAMVFGVLGKFIPYTPAQPVFEILVGCCVSFLFGNVIGVGLDRLRRRF